MSDLTHGPIRALALLRWAADVRAELACDTAAPEEREPTINGSAIEA